MAIPPKKKMRVGAARDAELAQNAPAALTATLVTDTPVELVWEIEGAPVLDLEFRLQVVQLGAGFNALNIPLSLRWQIMSLGHGDMTYDQGPFVSGTAFGNRRAPQWPVPARGVLVRFTGRSVRARIVNNAAQTAQVSASFQPVGSSAGFVPMPMFDCASSGTFGRGWFPPGAREWRVFNFDPLEDITVGAFDGTLVQFAPAITFATWNPIPLAAAQWVPNLSGNVQAEYR